MSQSVIPLKLTRPRRAARAPAKLGDENNTTTSSISSSSATTTFSKENIVSQATAGPRLATKASSGALGVKRSSAGSQTGGLGAKGVVPAAGARRALGDVSNATRDRTSQDRTSKEVVHPVKPVLADRAPRVRSTSAQPTSQPAPQPPSSTGTGISRLKIVSVYSSAAASHGAAFSSSSTVAGAPKARRATRGPGGVTADDIAWHGSWEHDDEAAVETLPKQRQNAVGVEGLGLRDARTGRDAVAQTMYSESSPIKSGIKRSHSSESRFEAGSGAVVDLESGGGEAYVDTEEDEDEKHDDKVLVMAEEDEEDWMMAVLEDEESEEVVRDIKREFEEQLDFWDTSMVAEYAGEIFEYMAELETAAMPSPRYMDHQTEIEWPMRSTLIDWLLQVHLRYHLVPETLWIAVNIIDRFLSNRIVSLAKFQLVGVTAMFVAAKYEEIMAPSVEEFVYMTEGGYTREEILKGERIILSSLEFNISAYCSPYTWVRRISKADDYNVQTRTLSKFLMEVTLLDHRFLRAKPSMIAAIGMYLARRMLGGDWDEAFIYYSNFTEAQLLAPASFLVEQIGADDFDKRFVYQKYSSKKFLKASLFARNWSTSNGEIVAAQVASLHQQPLA